MLEVERSLRSLSLCLEAWARGHLGSPLGLLLSPTLASRPRPPRAPASSEGGQRRAWHHMKGPTLLWEPASHSGTPSHRNVSKSQFDPVGSVCSHSPRPPPAPWATICHSPPEVCGLLVAPEAGTALQDFPWIHFQQTEASPPHLTQLKGEGGGGPVAGLPSPHLSQR